MAYRNVLNELLKDEAGASAVEYGLILALIVLAMIGAMSSVADTTIGMWNDVATKTATAINGG